MSYWSHLVSALWETLYEEFLGGAELTERQRWAAFEKVKGWAKAQICIIYHAKPGWLKSGHSGEKWATPNHARLVPGTSCEKYIHITLSSVAFPWQVLPGELRHRIISISRNGRKTDQDQDEEVNKANLWISQLPARQPWALLGLLGCSGLKHFLLSLHTLVMHPVPKPFPCEVQFCWTYSSQEINSCEWFCFPHKSVLQQWQLDFGV